MELSLFVVGVWEGADIPTHHFTATAASLILLFPFFSHCLPSRSRPPAFSPFPTRYLPPRRFLPSPLCPSLRLNAQRLPRSPSSRRRRRQRRRRR